MFDPDSLKRLTAQQEKAYRYILDRIEGMGMPPTLRELGSFMGFSSVGSVQDVVSALRKKGYLKHGSDKKSRSLIPAVHSFDKRSKSEIPDTVEMPIIEVPLLGSVPAGVPSEAIELKVGSMFVPSMIERSPGIKKQNLYALRTSGASMEGAGIFDGDLLLCHKQETANPSEIVVALVDEEATCKRLLKDPKRGWMLKAENPLFADRFADESAFVIIARVLSVQRFL